MAEMRQANGGKSVGEKDFQKFALCGKHGHLLRKEGVRVFRYADTLVRVKNHELVWKPFANRFKKGGEK